MEILIFFKYVSFGKHGMVPWPGPFASRYLARRFVVQEVLSVGSIPTDVFLFNRTAKTRANAAKFSNVIYYQATEIFSSNCARSFGLPVRHRTVLEI